MYPTIVISFHASFTQSWTFVIEIKQFLCENLRRKTVRKYSKLFDVLADSYEGMRGEWGKYPQDCPFIVVEISSDWLPTHLFGQTTGGEWTAYVQRTRKRGCYTKQLRLGSSKGGRFERNTSISCCLSLGERLLERGTRPWSFRFQLQP